MASFQDIMALRLHLAPQAVDTLSHCPAAVREQLQYELGDFLAAPPPSSAERHVPGAAGTAVLHSGFHVRYQLDTTRGLLHLLDLRAPAPLPHTV
jgi:hypothetical protein